VVQLDGALKVVFKGPMAVMMENRAHRHRAGLPDRQEDRGKEHLGKAMKIKSEGDLKPFPQAPTVRLARVQGGARPLAMITRDSTAWLELPISRGSSLPRVPGDPGSGRRSKHVPHHSQGNGPPT